MLCAFQWAYTCAPIGKRKRIENMQHIKWGRLSVELGPVDIRAPGLETIGAVKSKGEAYALGVSAAGGYFAFRPGMAPYPIPQHRVQAAIAEAKTGMRNPSQAERMAANAARREAHALREAERLKNKVLNAKSAIDAPTTPDAEKTR